MPLALPLAWPAERPPGEKPLTGPDLAARSAWPVALVCMPFVSAVRPSIQLGLLKALAAAHGFPAATFHLHLDFAAAVGLELYEALSQHRGRLLGDWLFSLAAFGDEAPGPEDRFLDDFADAVDPVLAGAGATREDLRRLRRTEVPRYLDRLVEEVPWQDFRVVGFSSTFQQNAASFALAARLKRRFPHLVTLFGGANFEGEMGLELVRSVGCIDHAVIGEGDRAFPAFLAALAEGRDPAVVPGVVSRRDGAVTPLCPPGLFHDLDRLPVPDYEEYFQRAEALGLLGRHGRRRVGIPFESARGCWWGQKHHCTFCGLNGAGMAFRAKSPGRVADELAELARRHGSFRLEAVDNIVDPSYLETLFAALARAGSDYELFYEVKSNLTREQVRVLRLGGVTSIQPGIESLSTPVLRLMRKGVTAIQNVNTLRWARYHGLDVGWNILWGFPGETEEDYRRQVELLGLLAHLQPPGHAGRIWMERFSPLFADRQAFPARGVRPEASYGYVYPRRVRLDRVAYFFDYELEGTLPEAVYEGTRERVRAWQAAWEGPEKPSLTFWSSPGLVQVEDRRSAGAVGVHTFREPLAGAYAACSDRPTCAAEVKRRRGLDWSEADVEAMLDEFCARGVMMREGNLFLALALPASPGR
jgi:ribosomal peptide maturation radical SAM protein 1